MMPPLDVLPASSTAYFYFNTFTSAGASVTASNFAVGDILIYKNGSTTQRTSTSGFTLLDTDGLDFDGTTGIHGFSVDLSDNTDAGFYAVGSTYSVIVGPITVNAVTVNFVAGRFRIVPAESVAGYPLVDTQKWLGGAIPAVNVTGVPLVDLKYTLGTVSPAAAGSVALDWAQVSNKTSTVALTGTTIAVTQKVDVDTIKTNPVVNGGTATFPTNATLASTTNITAAAGVALTAAYDAAKTAATQASVDTIDDFVDTEVAAIKAKTDNLPSDPADASDIAAAFSTVNSTLSTIAGYIDTEVAAIKAKTDSLTFTVAGQVDANIQYVNDVQVNGNGQTGTEWGP
jgi:hypothetical protein